MVMKFNYDALDPNYERQIDQAWTAASEVLNPNTLGYTAAETHFREAYQFAQHAGGYHFGGEKGARMDLNERVLAVHGMWRDTMPSAPDSAARVFGFMAALSATMNEGGNAQ